ncbi:bifunctional serine/threonine-protein kinase/universal stress protein [Rhodobacter sp. 24-YEA-8]|uniref:bifunctional serine/threonine-protein kinase/universal stress protein n=1 Tax=Rhodobacter sp. 24-YEA-8 TaxID=1884310 RepID=UPI000896CADB|nr:bifunctional serine/threonine-protein kinase/universal stress protein [Rhodobacter sp. 24-YEA-8]SEC11773.1 non-specific serine/threonine protein kinase/protein-serine/threonine kinase [Rhodobacter sp. 24-YEA-8]
MSRSQKRPVEGLQIDGFTLGPLLHRGGFATIWEVTHPNHPGPMVMKVPTILDGDDGPTIVGFEIEQMILPRLSGPHVPQLIAAGDFAVMPYLVTAKLPGASFQELFDRAPLPPDQLVALAIEIASALHEVHRQRVIHLDLKPGNLMRDEAGRLVLIDYGLARHLDLPDLLGEEFAIPMGTFPYIAPEQYLHHRDDPRSDIFAFGAMLYELATGRLPFGQTTTLRAVRRRLWRDPLPPRALNPELPPWLQEIILRALEVEPEERFQSAAQMAFDLGHPDQVQLTARATKLSRDGIWPVLRRRWRARRIRGYLPAPTAEDTARAQVVMAAVDLSPEMEALSQEILSATREILHFRPEARLACVNVLRSARIQLDQGTDEAGNNLHVARLVALKAWGEALGLPEGRVTYTVLEAPDPGNALTEHATRILAGHIVMGARASSALRRYLGSVSAQVVAEAPCTVTIVRLPAPGG